MNLDTSLWFRVTDLTQFVALLPVGFMLGVAAPALAFPPPAYRTLVWIGITLVFWTFILTVRALTGIVPWQQSIGTVLLNVLFVVAIYVGMKVRERLM